MSKVSRIFLVANRCCYISQRGVKDRFRPSLVALTGAGKTYEQRLAELEKSSSAPSEPGNIGLAPVSYVLEKNDSPLKWKLETRKDPSHRSILDEINTHWIAKDAPMDISKVASHYDVFKHLFGDAIFYPQFDWNISYNAADTSGLQRVLFGNKISAASCLRQPEIEFKLPLLTDTSHWCLVMTALDGNVFNANNEFVLWMAANLPGGVKDPLAKADVVVPYQPPFPPQGLGFCRVAFVLYKQINGRIGNPSELLSSKVVDNDLKTREFSSLKWYESRQDILKPASLRFFQSFWDESVTETYQKVFNMREPRFAYDTPEPFRPDQLIRPPEDEAFNEYLDRYRDRKDIAEQVFKYYLYHSKPVGPRRPPSKYLNLKRQDPRKTVSWIRDEEKAKNLRQGKWKDLPSSY